MRTLLTLQTLVPAGNPRPVAFGTIVTGLLLALLLAAPAGRSQSVSLTKPQIAVLNLESRGVDENETATLSDRLRNELVKTEAFVVVDREYMDRTLAEQGFQMTGCTLQQCAVEAGQILNVRKIVIGSIGKVGGTYAINIHLIDVASGRMEQSFKQDHRGRIDGLLPVLEKLAVEMAEKAAGSSPTSGQAQRKYRLKIFSHPSGAEVIINGKAMGKTPLAGNVPHARKLNLVIRRAGYAEWQKSITMEDNLQVNAELAPLKTGSSKTWLWVAGGVGAAALGTAAYVYLAGRESNGGNNESLPAFPWPPK